MRKPRDADQLSRVMELNSHHEPLCVLFLAYSSFWQQHLSFHTCYFVNFALKVQATLVISTPDNSIPSLISKWNESPIFFSIKSLHFGSGYLKVWITWNYGYLKVDFQSQIASYVCLYYCLSQSVNCQSQNVMWHFEDYLFAKYIVGKSSKLIIHRCIFHNLYTCNC